MAALQRLWKQHKEMILYVFFGGCTTLVNIAVYGICYYLLSVNNVAATIIAWILSVFFAFVTNKLWVFESKSMEKQVLLRELGTFLACRAATGVMDLAIMFVCVDLLHWNAMLIKIVSNVLVIILNFVASKLLIFTQKKN